MLGADEPGQIAMQGSILHGDAPEEVLAMANSGSRLDRLPMSPWHYWITALITAGLFLDTFELYSGGSVLANLVQTGWSSNAINATFLSVTFFGLVFGSGFAGILGDRYGRRFCYQANLALFGFASIAGAFAPNMTALIVLRFFMGLGLGAEVVIGYATLAEFLPKANRGRVMATAGMIVNMSFFTSLAIAYFVIPAFGWRAMFLIPGLAAIGIWLVRKSMPESPRWLESTGRFRDADTLLQQIEAKVGRRHAIPPFEPAPPAPTEQVSLAVLFSRHVWRNTLVGITINIATNFTLYGFLQWLPTVFVQRGLTLGSSLQISMIMALGMTCGAFVSTFLSDRFGRKPTIIAFSVAAAVIGAGTILTTGATFLVAAFGLTVMLGCAIAVAFTVYVPELFETRFRLRGAGLCNTVGRLASSGVQYLIVLLLAWGGLGAITGALSGVLLLQAVVVWWIGIETKKRPLDNEQVVARLPSIGHPAEMQIVR